jgi:hypothetical protein
MSCKTQIGWNRVNQILAPYSGENFLLKEVAMTTITRQRPGGL